MENFNYVCIGNEAVINDCPKNSNRCPQWNDFVSRSKLTCKGKTQLLSRIGLRNTKKSVLFYFINIINIVRWSYKTEQYKLDNFINFIERQALLITLDNMPYPKLIIQNYTQIWRLLYYNWFIHTFFSIKSISIFFLLKIFFYVTYNDNFLSNISIKEDDTLVKIIIQVYHFSNAQNNHSI